MKGCEAEAGEEIKLQRRSDRAQAAPVGRWEAQVAHHSHPAVGCNAGPFHPSSLSAPSGGGLAAEAALREPTGKCCLRANGTPSAGSSFSGGSGDTSPWGVVRVIKWCQLTSFSQKDQRRQVKDLHIASVLTAEILLLWIFLEMGWPWAETWNF